MTLIGYIGREIKILVQRYKNKRFEKTKMRAVKQAVELATGSGRKHMVVLLGGKLVIVSKQRLKRMIDTRKFVKGTTIRDLEKHALFVTK